MATSTEPIHTPYAPISQNATKTYTIAIIPGDGIGPEVSYAMQRAVEAALSATSRNTITWHSVDAGETSYARCGSPLPQETIDAIENARVAIKGPTGTPKGGGWRSINVELRKRFDLFANVRPVKYYEGVNSPLKEPEGIDLVIMRENIEDLYAGIEYPVGAEKTKNMLETIARDGTTLPQDSAIAIKYLSEHGSDRIARYACDYARANGYHAVTAVAKPNILKDTDGMFLRRAAAVAGEYTDLTFNDLIVDNATQQLVRWPKQFGVIVTPNLYGDIISDLAAATVGGLGIAPGANIGTSYAIFEAVHGTAPDIAGQNKANPTALILSSAMMLRHLGEEDAADTLEGAVASVLREGTAVTGDLKPQARGYAPVGTNEMTDAIIAKMRTE